MLCSDQGMSFDSMEAIRLGAVKYDLETEKTSTFDQYIKPESTKPLSAFCKNLTGITDEDLEKANSFTTVFSEFLSWVGGVKKSQFFSWSQSDLIRLKLDASVHDIPNSVLSKIEKRYIDFQEIFTKRVSKTNASVETALQLYGLDFIGEKHNPMYDSYNTLRIYQQFLRFPIVTDLIMVEKFIFDNDSYLIGDINEELDKRLKSDLISLVGYDDVFQMKEAKKLVKKTRNLVKKYNNIRLNRSGLFNETIIRNIENLIRFHHRLVAAYEEHAAFSSNVLILDEYLYQPLNAFKMK